MMCVKLSGEHAKAIQTDIESLPKHFKEGYFDLIVCSHVLEHVYNPTEAIEIMKNLSSGLLLIAVPNIGDMISLNVWKKRKKINKGHRHGWDANHLYTFLEETHNLNILRWQPDRVFSPFPFNHLISKNRFMVDTFEQKLFPKMFPNLGRSLIVLCKK